MSENDTSSLHQCLRTPTTATITPPPVLGYKQGADSGVRRAWDISLLRFTFLCPYNMHCDLDRSKGEMEKINFWFWIAY